MVLPETCEEFEAALPLFVGSDLEAGEMDAVRRHLDGCESCRLELRRAQTARDVLIGLRDEHASALDGPSLWEGMRDVLGAEGHFAGEPNGVPNRVSALRAAAGAASTPRPWRRVGGRLGIGGIAAAAAVLFAFTLAGRFGPAADPTGAPGAGLRPMSSVAVPARGLEVRGAANPNVPSNPVPVIPESRAVAVTPASDVQRLRRAGASDEHLTDTARTLMFVPGSTAAQNGARSNTQTAGNR
ncbi:MAG: hypothetical protein GY711_30015 [bacterium]|nr:hypothetical protein [bacterium]